MLRCLAVVTALAALSVLSGCNCGDSRREPDGGEPADGGGAIDGGTAVDAGVLGDAGAAEDAGSGDAGPGAGVDGGLPLGRLELVAQSATGDIIVVQEDGGARVLASWLDAGASSTFMAPRWQPHGDQVAFADGDRVWLAFADGGLRRIESTVTFSTDFQGSVRRVEWSPGGERLAFGGLELSTDNDAVFLLPDDGGVEPMLVGVAERWAWAHDGTGLYFTDYVPSEGTWRTWFRPVDGGAAVAVVDGLLLDVSSTGALAYQDDFPLLDGGYFSAQYLLASDGGAGGLVLPEGTLVVDRLDDAAFGPDGTRMALSGTDPAALPGHRYRSVIASGAVVERTLYDQTTVTEAWPTCLRWEPGGRLSYQTQDAGVPVLFLETSDGGTESFAVPPLAQPFGLGCLDWRRVP